MSQPRTFTLREICSPFLISIANALGLVFAKPLFAAMAPALPAGFSWRGLLGFTGVFGGFYIIATSSMESEALGAEVKEKKRERVGSGTESMEEPTALLSVYGQERLDASFRPTRWVIVGFGSVISGIYTLMREIDR